MDNQKAIDELKKYANSSWGSLSESFELAIKALKRQIPIKPVYDGNTLECHVCESLVVANEDIYCWTCGQKLK